MHFQLFIQNLQEQLSRPLPGETAQLKMAPLRRLSFKEYDEQGIKNPKHSAVLVCFYPYEDSIYTVLMLRPSEQGAHSNQVSFPGGRVEEADVSLEATALREAQEEIGIDAEQVHVIGRLSPVYIPVSNYHVQPVVGFMNARPEFVPNRNEVSAILEVNPGILYDEKIKGESIFKSGIGTNIEAPYYEIQDHKIWGATAMMLCELEAILRLSGF